MNYRLGCLTPCPSTALLLRMQ
ncbi:hypothetical protein V3C99_016099 [Haemonchus contortus]